MSQLGRWTNGQEGVGSPQHYDLRFTIFLFPHKVGICKAHDPREHTGRCALLESELLVKIFLAHSYPGFFRTGDLICARVSDRGRLAEIFA